jgi:hypothetical protein
MKLVDANIIAKAEGIFYNSMSSILDQESIVKLFKDNYKLRLSGGTQFQDMDVVVFNDKVAFRFDYTATAYFSILMDRYGEFIEIENDTKQSDIYEADSNRADGLLNAKFIREKESQLADAIADAIDRETLVRLIEINSHSKLTGRLDFMGAQFIVYQNRLVYNLIYQGEIALSFSLNQNGKFLDYAEPQPSSNDDRHTFKSTDKSPSQSKEIVIGEKDLEDHELPEFFKDPPPESHNDEEADIISRLFINND